MTKEKSLPKNSLEAIPTEYAAKTVLPPPVGSLKQTYGIFEKPASL